MNRLFTPDEIRGFLADYGFTSNPEGLIQHHSIDYAYEGENLAYLDINADAVRKGDEVPERPIRVTFEKASNGLSLLRWRVKSVGELAPGIPSTALDRQEITPKISPWPIEPNMRVACSAHHEAGHIVVAAVLGLTLRPDGLMVATTGDGLSVYASRPDNSDDSRERVIVSIFAGHSASEVFCSRHSCPELLPNIPELTPDWRDARPIIVCFSAPYLAAGNGPDAVLARLRDQSRRLVEEHWSVIEKLAAALIAKDVEPMKPLNDGSKWLEINPDVKYMSGEEAVQILERCGIATVCKPRAEHDEPEHPLHVGLRYFWPSVSRASHAC